MRLLHIIRDPHETLGLELARHQAGGHRVSLLLVQDGVLARPDGSPARVYALADDLEARGRLGAWEAVDYDGAVRLIAEHDKVYVW